jgi:hypothetical protein
MKCEHCGDPLPASSRRNRRFCDARCRRRAFEERQHHVAPSAEGATPELAPVVPISEEAQVRELLARVLAEERLVAHVAAAAKTNWRASAWLLERHYPERWAPVRRSALDEEPVPVAPNENDPFAEVDSLAARRRARQHVPD